MTRTKTYKEELFIRYYIETFSARQAAQMAGYGANANQAAKLLKRPHIAAEIKATLEDLSITSQEILLRLTAVARNEGSQYWRADGTFDLDACRDDGRGHLIKSVTTNRDGQVEVTLHDSLVALTTLAKVYNLLVDKVETSGVVTLRVVYGEKPTEHYQLEAHHTIDG